MAAGSYFGSSCSFKKIIIILKRQMGYVKAP